MLTRSLYERAASRGVTLEELAETLGPLAPPHFGPRVKLELTVNAERARLELFAVFRVAADEHLPATLAIDRVMALLTPEVELGDELMFQLFVSPEDGPEATAQDTQYDVLTGLSSVCCGFWSVLRAALTPVLDLPSEEEVSRVLRALRVAVAPPAERAAGFVLRQGMRGELLLKQAVTVGAGEIAPGHFRRRDVLEGVQVEVTRRAVPVGELITGLFDTDAVARACDGTTFAARQLEAILGTRDVHLARRTAFRVNVDRLRAEPKPAVLAKFVAVVASERDARFIP